MAKKRDDRSTSDAKAGFDSPFAKLAPLRASLPEGQTPKALSEAEPRAVDQGPPRRAIVRRERAGRGGRTVTLVEGLGLDAAALEALASEMKRELGCGAYVEGSALVLQGDLEERAAAALERRGVGEVVLGTRKGGKK